MTAVVMATSCLVTSVSRVGTSARRVLTPIVVIRAKMANTCLIKYVARASTLNARRVLAKRHVTRAAMDLTCLIARVTHVYLTVKRVQGTIVVIRANLEDGDITVAASVMQGVMVCVTKMTALVRVDQAIMELRARNNLHARLIAHRVLTLAYVRLVRRATTDLSAVGYAPSAVPVRVK